MRTTRSEPAIVRAWSRVIALDGGTSNTRARLIQDGRIVAACLDGVPIIRWLEVSGRHMILRPNQQGREYPLVPVDLEDPGSAVILGQVVWSWSRFSNG